MTRAEYNEYRYIKKTFRELTPTDGTVATIKTNASADYKHRLDALYAENNLHPACIRVDNLYFDDNERIIYIYGRNDVYKDYAGREYGWEELYTAQEKERFERALTDDWNK